MNHHHHHHHHQHQQQQHLIPNMIFSLQQSHQFRTQLGFQQLQANAQVLMLVIHGGLHQPPRCVPRPSWQPKKGCDGGWMHEKHEERHWFFWNLGGKTSKFNDWSPFFSYKKLQCYWGKTRFSDTPTSHVCRACARPSLLDPLHGAGTQTWWRPPAGWFCSSLIGVGHKRKLLALHGSADGLFHPIWGTPEQALSQHARASQMSFVGETGRPSNFVKV